MLKLITHKDDLDGISCNIVAMFMYDTWGQDWDTTFLSYRNVDEEIQKFIRDGEYRKYNHILITDLSLKKETAELINEASILHPDTKWELLDHHDTIENMDLNKYEWATIVAKDDTGRPRSAARLLFDTYETRITPKYRENVRAYVEIVSDYDTYYWKKINRLDCKDLHDLLTLQGRDEFMQAMRMKLVKHVNLFILFEEEEMYAIELNKRRVAESISYKLKQVKFGTMLDINGNEMKFGYVFIDDKATVSELGHTICEKNPEIDFSMMICPAANDVSLRATKTGFHLGDDIAKKYGGGGHPQAAGFRIENMQDIILSSIVHI